VLFQKYYAQLWKEVSWVVHFSQQSTASFHSATTCV